MVGAHGNMKTALKGPSIREVENHGSFYNMMGPTAKLFVCSLSGKRGLLLACMAVNWSSPALG